jgi:hypothetical protein
MGMSPCRRYCSEPALAPGLLVDEVAGRAVTERLAGVVTSWRSTAWAASSSANSYACICLEHIALTHAAREAAAILG